MYQNSPDLSIYYFLKDKLRVCKTTVNKSETIVRCPYCGDSLNNAKDAHFYINNYAPFKFYCQKCNVTGLFSDSVLIHMGLFNAELSSKLSKCIVDYKINLNKRYGSTFESYFSDKKNLDILPNQYNAKEIRKIDYINGRLGIDISSNNDIEKYKIILNLTDFLNNNGVPYKNNKTPEELRKIDVIDDHYVGFLLTDKNMIVFRNINSGEEERYCNFKVYNETYNISKKFYVISNDIDLSSNVFNLYLTEGIFDIIGVYNHIYNQQMKSNDIFIGCKGKSYNFVINSLKDIGILNCNINIYSDSDVNVKWFQDKLMRFNTIARLNGINLYYNNVSKDFGVPKNNIEVRKVIKLSGE